MNKNLSVGILVVVAAAVLGWFIFKNQAMPSPKSIEQSVPSQTTMQSFSEPIMESTDSSVAGVREFTVTGSSFKFDTPEIKVKKGDTVKITFKNTGGMHNFVIDEFNVKTKPAQSPSQETVTFVADKTGQFAYYCSIGQHRANGMEGKLIVE